MAKADSAAPIRVIEATPAYWRVVFDYPPFNILDATIFEGLQHLLDRMPPARACVSSYSRARLLISISPTLI